MPQIRGGHRAWTFHVGFLFQLSIPHWWLSHELDVRWGPPRHGLLKANFLSHIIEGARVHPLKNIFLLNDGIKNIPNLYFDNFTSKNEV